MEFNTEITRYSKKVSSKLIFKICSLKLKQMSIYSYAFENGNHIEDKDGGHEGHIINRQTNDTRSFELLALLSVLVSPFSSVQFSHLVMSNSLRPHGLQHARHPCPSPTPGACSKSCPLSWWWHLTISPLSPLSLPALNLSQHQGLFQWVCSSHQVAKVLEFQLQHQSFQCTFRTDFL